jgi:hypothetical protein
MAAEDVIGSSATQALETSANQLLPEHYRGPIPAGFDQQPPVPRLAPPPAYGPSR